MYYIAKLRWLEVLSRICRSLVVGLGLAACSSSGQFNYDVEHTALSLRPADLETHGVGFLTPAAATGSEADKQALAQSFAGALGDARPDVRIRGLAEVLNDVNAADLDQEYKAMYRDYLQTGILDAEVLADVSEVSRVRFLAQLSLAGFTQGNRGRFSFFGLRVLDTKWGTLRVFLQIWDAQIGAVVWEASAELSYAYDSGLENPVTFGRLCQLAADSVFAELPQAGGGSGQ